MKIVSVDIIDRKISAELGYNRLYASRISGLRAS